MQEKLIKVGIIGTGGCGGNILGDIYQDLKSSKDVSFNILNTDIQALNLVCEKGFPKELTHQIGERATKGLGAGSVPEVGRSAAQEDIEFIRFIIEDKDLVIVITGLGGGTGSGATPVILEEAKQSGALTLCWTVLPSEFEGVQRNKIAKKALKDVDSIVDSYIVISNDASESVVFKDSIDEINSSISMGIQIIIDVLVNAAFINLDFADFSTVLKNGGRSYFSYASFDGDKRSDKVVKELSRLVLQPKSTMKKVQRAVMFVRGGSDMRKEELKTIVSSIQGKLSEDALVLLGVTVKEDKGSLDAVFLGTTGVREN